MNLAIIADHRHRTPHSPRHWAAAVAACGLAYLHTAQGRPDHLRRQQAARTRIRLTSPEPPLRPGRKPQEPVEPRHPRDSQAARHGQTLKTPGRPTPQANQPRSRKIQARLYQSEAVVNLLCWKYRLTI